LSGANLWKPAEDSAFLFLLYRIYVRQTIEAGLKDSEDGRTVDVQEVRKKFGLAEKFLNMMTRLYGSSLKNRTGLFIASSLIKLT
jgi:hypothetical protein